MNEQKEIEPYAIKVQDLVKSFKVYQDRTYSVKDRLLLRKNKYETRTVINGISFQVKKGEAVGLIGNNGCGKSTTLKLLTRIIYPDSGNIQINGRVSSLLELGAGFHPDMTGRENIYINAAIFGLARKEIDRRYHSLFRAGSVYRPSGSDVFVRDVYAACLFSGDSCRCGSAVD